MTLVTKIHTITQMGYKVSFDEDFEGMVTISYTCDIDSGFYKHEHLGAPDGSMEKLTLSIEKSLSNFINNHV